MNTTPDSQSSVARRGCLRWAALILGGLAALVVVLVAVAWIAGVRAKAELRAKHPPPGQMVDVGGYKLHLNCQGQGSPTVLLEAGSGNSSLSWVYVQPEVATFTRVCAYDRAGMGWSDSSPRPRTAEVIVDELNALLTNAGIEGPYVLVGHSLGGLFVRLYAYQHPEEVVGMVLVDSVHDEQLVREPRAFREWNEKYIAQVEQQLRIGQLLSAIGLMALAPENVPGDPDLPPDTDETRRALIATDPSFFQTLLAVGENLDESYAQVRAVQSVDLGEIPLVVLSRGVPQQEPDPSIGLTTNIVQQREQVWAELQAELAELSSSGELVIAQQSGHSIQLDQPGVVIDSIQRVVEAAER